MNSEPIANAKPTPAELAGVFAEAGLPAEMAAALDRVWRRSPESPAPAPLKAPASILSVEEVAALEPVFAPLWKSRWGSITWVEMLHVLMTCRPTRSRRDPETKRAKEKFRSLLRRLPTDFWPKAAAGIDDLKTLDPRLKDRLLSICRKQVGRARKARKRAGGP